MQEHWSIKILSNRLNRKKKKIREEENEERINFKERETEKVDNDVEESKEHYNEIRKSERESCNLLFFFLFRCGTGPYEFDETRTHSYRFASKAC